MTCFKLCVILVVAQGGILEAGNMGSSSWNHYVTLVGYDVGDVDASGEPLRRNGYWILRNSWGNKWGVGVRPVACPSPCIYSHRLKSCSLSL